MTRHVLIALVLCALSPTALAQTVGTCNTPLSDAFLDASNVRARVPNKGILFLRNNEYVYRVPRFGTADAIFNAALWISAEINDEVRAAASRTLPFLYAGPLDETGAPPANCAAYDRIYKLSPEDIEDYEQTGIATPDLRDWPTGLGAPTQNAAGIEVDVLSEPLAVRQNRVIDLEAGERPLMKGTQMLWWVMNDAGNIRAGWDSPPMGVEIHVTAYAIQTDLDAVNNATFYHYRIFNKSLDRMDNAHVGFWVDPDLGDAGDDYVGSDSARGLGYVYNADNDDEGTWG